MNCDAARRLLFDDERPDRSSDDDVRRHLAACPACRVLGRRLAQVERHIPQLPVPPSAAKAAFVRRFLRTGGPVVRRVPMPWPTPVKERGLRKLSLAVSIAAVLAVFALAWGLWPHFPPPQATQPPPALVKGIHDRIDAAVALSAPADRVAGLTALVKDLRSQAGELSRLGKTDDLALLVTEYAKLVRDVLPENARLVPATDRAVVLGDAAEELRRAESEFSRLKTERPYASSVALQQLAEAARDGSRSIQELLKAA
jgi:hypothetical protein